jgi:RNA-directed DNA polymerase
MNTAIAPMDQWHIIGGVKIGRQGLKLPKRLDRAAKREDHRPIRRLQNLWRRSRAATLRAGRQVTQDHHGKHTPGVDGVAKLTPQARRDVVKHLHLGGHASPVRRGYIPQPGTTEPRPVGIPTLADRAKQALVQDVLEPGWDAPFAPNSDGCRPGRSTWEARGAIDVQFNQHPTWVLDAGIAKGFDHINHDAL